MLVEANIPLFKVQHGSFRRVFLEGYNQPLPDHTTLRKGPLKQLYEDTIFTIQLAIGDSRSWISIDETTDAKGQLVVNTVICALNAGETVDSIPAGIGGGLLPPPPESVGGSLHSSSLRCDYAILSANAREGC